jgi:cytidylate kinase
MRSAVVAADGPAGSGKSSVCRGVAVRLGMRYLDTGAMYRAMTWAVLDAGISPDDADRVAALVPTVEIVSGTDPQGPTIHVGSTDVAGPIRGDAVTGAVSAVSAVPEVRSRLVEIQRQAVRDAQAVGEGIVVEGRDITTVVLPDADLKIFITARPEVRAERRARQDVELGNDAVDVQQTHSALLERDAKDSGRALSPLAQAADAIVIDTSDETLDEVIARVSGLIDALPG